MRRVVTSAFVGIVVLCSGANLLADEPDSLASLRKMKLAAAEEWCAALEARQEAVDVDLVDLLNATKALRDAQLDLAASKAERVRALEVYRDRVQVLFDRIDVLHKAGRRGGEAERRAEARFHLLDAKIRLRQEEGKP